MRRTTTWSLSTAWDSESPTNSDSRWPQQLTKAHLGAHDRCNKSAESHCFSRFGRSGIPETVPERRKNNYRNLLRYVRKYIDGKSLFTAEPGDPQTSVSSLLYYPSENDDLNFSSVSEYESFLKSKGRFNENAPAIILTGQMGVPDSLIAALEHAGNTVYPVNTIQLFIKTAMPTPSLRQP